MQPLEKSANSWMWNPCTPGSSPVILYVILVSAESVCSKEIVPVTLGLAAALAASHGLPFGPTWQVAFSDDMCSCV